MTATSDEKRALQLYEMGLSAVRARGVPVTIGLTSLNEYRAGNLIVRYFRIHEWLDVWCVRKVLTVKRWQGQLRVIRYFPGSWEQQLEAMAKKLIV